MHMKKISLKEILKRKAAKRIVSGLTALVLVFGVFPVAEIGEKINEYNLSYLNAKAASPSDPDSDFLHDNTTFAISVSISDFAKYSINYQTYYEYHKKDNITITGSTLGANTTIFQTGFVSLGNSNAPFEGSITIEEGFESMILNLDKPLFSHVKDSVDLNGSVGLNISRSYPASSGTPDKTPPIIADNVYSGGEASAKIWKVNLSKPSMTTQSEMTDLQDFGGFIGTMKQNSKLVVNATMNKEGDDDGTKSLIGKSNLGLACGLMEASSQLTFSFVSDRGDSEAPGAIEDITTSNGSVGGLVGKMMSGSKFTYEDSSCKNVQVDGKAITTSNGYAGGIVGENIGGTVDIKNTTSAYKIKQAITGNKGSGGVYGYYSPAKPSNNSDDIFNTKYYSIDCRVNGGGFNGGVFGVLESNHNFTITDDTTLNNQPSPATIKSNHEETECSAYGGLIGRYQPIADESVENDEIKSKVLSIGVSKVNTSNGGKAKKYGGGIGIIADKDQTDTAAYVMFNNFEVVNAANAGTNLTFGGLVGRASKSFVDANKVTVKASSFKGGGLVGDLGNGILRMKGIVTLTNASPSSPGNSESMKIGQIVGFRDDALVFAEKDFELNRCNSVEVDDIGGWGEVVRFKNTTTANSVTTNWFDASDTTAANAILSVDEATHMVTIKSPSSSYTSIANKHEFAKTALCMQITASNNDYLSFNTTQPSSFASSNITLTGNVVLTGTGITGLTRDNDITEISSTNSLKNCTYSGTFNGGNYTVTLAIGEYYGKRNGTALSNNDTEGNGKIYRHKYNGLIGVSNNTNTSKTTVNYTTLNGNIFVKAKSNKPNNDATAVVYVGSAVAFANDSIKFQNVTNSTAISYKGDDIPLIIGGLLGCASSDINAITFKTITSTCNISGEAASNQAIIGGVVGKIAHSTNAARTWSFDTVTVTGSISNTGAAYNHKMGGLIAVIEPYSVENSTYNSRALSLKTIRINDLAMQATTNSNSGVRSMGGLLGYSWLNVDADFDDVQIDEASDTGSSITLTGAASGCGDLAGLVYNGTGHWTVNDANDVKINKISVSSSNSKSFGMFVNKAWYSSGDMSKADSSALFLELKNKDSYKISNATISLQANTVYDELAAYTAYYRDSGVTRYTADESGDPYILKNGNAVISIRTSLGNGGIKTDGSSASNTYKPQTEEGKAANPNARYYYNLNELINNHDLYPKKLMLWGVNKYAHKSIKTNFDGSLSFPAENSEATGFDPDTKEVIYTTVTTRYYMSGYSWYPIDWDGGNITINGDFKLFNKEFETSETKNGSAQPARSSLYDTDNNTTTQHYLMHCGLFRNVNGDTITIGNVKLQGNVASTKTVAKNSSNADVETPVSGVFVCGTVSGLSATNKATITKSSTGTIALDGVYIHNLSGTTTYAPLFINRISEHTITSISAVRVPLSTSYTSSSKVPYIYKDSGIPKAATSLIGDVGLSKTATDISVTFSDIRLDGRTAVVSDSTKNTELNTAYNTTRTLFTKATLLNKFQYNGNGGNGVYNYTWEEDWTDGGTHADKGVTYGAEVGYTKTRDDAHKGEYPDEERKYNGSEKFTNPINSNDTSGTTPEMFDNFLPYVATAYVKDDKTHQLKVNHSSSNFTGCGTYNDPYRILKGSELVTIAKIIEGSDPQDGFEINVNASVSNWCTGNTGTSKHSTYRYNSTDDKYYLLNTSGEPTSQTITKTNLRTYLASAYYSIDDNITIDSTEFHGLGNTSSTSDTFALFRGVITGNKTIEIKTDAPFIANSSGCVVKGLNIKINNNDISYGLTTSDTFKIYGGCPAYGAVIAKVFGGDNIIDGVTLSFDSSTRIKLANDAGTGSGVAQLIPVGGYIGVVVSGGVIFRNMSSTHADVQGIPTNSTVVIDYEENKIDPSTSADNSNKWLYVNPIIGRVLNGYAVTESSGYRTSENSVTMQNGTKNYSIADINKDETNKLNVGNYSQVTDATTMYSTDVTIPNDQALFIMSLLTQSSTTISSPSDPKLTASDSYMKENKRVHAADYDKVGDTEELDDTYSDYVTAKTNDIETDAGVPYIVREYTVVHSNKYNVFALTNANTVCNFSFGGETKDWYLPDGFRGIGYIGFGKSSLNNNYISLHKLNGKNKNGSGEKIIIHLNMFLQHYQDTFDDKYKAASNGGFGLFNTLRHNRSDQGTFDDEDIISELDLTGNITYYVYQNNGAKGAMTYTSGNIAKASYLNTGGLAGYAGFDGNDSITVKEIDVSGLTVDGFETAGGFFGKLLLKNDTAHQVTISDIDATQPFTVKGKRYVGGIIGYFNRGNLKINSVTILSPTVLSYYIGNGNQDFENGVGGIVGFVSNSGSNKPVEITNVTMGSLTSTDSNKIGYNKESDYSTNQDAVAAGGVIGRSATEGKDGKSYSLLLKSCNINKISVYGHKIGGLIGTDGVKSGNTASNSYIEIYDCHVKSPTTEGNRCTLYGKTIGTSDKGCGGLVGGVHNKSIIIDSCSIEGYILQGSKDTGGMCAWLNAGALTIRNVKVKDILIKSLYSGSISGWTQVDVVGYNILCDNVQFQNDKGKNVLSADNGYIFGKVKNKVRIIGFSRQNTAAANNCFVPERLAGVGNNALAIDNSDNRYVIFADYKYDAENETSKVFSTETNNCTNVTKYGGDEVTDNYPYVTSSPKLELTNTQFLTGDGVSSAYASTSAFNSIVSEKSNTSLVGRYTNPTNNPTYNSEIQSKYWTRSSVEFAGVSGIRDFPMLIVDNSDRTEVTNLINYYLGSLTNTSFNFAQNSNSNKYETKIYKYTYNNGSFTATESGANLEIITFNNSTYFELGSSFDNADPNVQQFTLIDVRFKNPSSTGQVAYHLYVPVYVKKLLKYSFDLKLAPNTNYYKNAYQSSSFNTLFENLGTPVTMRFEYKYARTMTEWKDAINGGDSVMTNYYKGLTLTGSFPSNAKLVLVDPNNFDKHYYLDTPPTGSIDLESFSGYTPAPLNNLMRVTIEASSTGKLVRTANDGASSEGAYVKGIDGKYYKYDPDSSSTKYAVTDVQPIDSSNTEITESYYLSIFTQKPEQNASGTGSNVYTLEIGSKDTFAKHGTTDEHWSPNKIVDSDANKRAHLFIGDIYKNTILTTDFSVDSMTGNNQMDESNYALTVKMTSVVELSAAAKTSSIPSNLRNNIGQSFIYQTFLMNYDVNDKTEGEKFGVHQKPALITIKNYKIYSGTSVSGTGTNLPKDKYSILENYIEFRNEKDLVEYLIDSENDYAATIQIEYQLVYDSDSLGNQFPQGTDSDAYGSRVIGYSNISSSIEDAAYSSTSYRQPDPDNNHLFYTADPIKATLTYEADKNESDSAGYYGALGINPFEATSGSVSISSQARYNFSNLTTSDNYVEFNLTLSNKKLGYSNTLKISDYLTNLKIFGSNTSTPLFDQSKTAAEQSNTTDVVVTKTDNKYTIRVHKDKLNKVIDGVYTIKITFDVLTGDSNGFGDTKAYSNYMVSLSADLYPVLIPTGSESINDKASAEDHIIYTNAKIQSKVIR